MSYFIIVSDVDGKTRIEGFYLDCEVFTAVEDLELIAKERLSQDCYTLEDGTIGFYSDNGNRVYIEERDPAEIRL